MRSCIECNYKFRFNDRLKAAFTVEGKLKCPQCNSTYKPELNIYRGIYFVLIATIYNAIFEHINFDNIIVRILIITLGVYLFDLLPHRYQKYTKID